MSAREGIADIIHDVSENPIKIGDVSDRLDKYEKHLRSHGWLHESDVVEGKTVEFYQTGGYDYKSELEGQDGD